MTSNQMSRNGIWDQDITQWRGFAELQKVTVIGYNNSRDVIEKELEISKSNDESDSILLPTNALGTIISFKNPDIWHRYTSFMTPEHNSQRLLISLFCHHRFEDIDCPLRTSVTALYKTNKGTSSSPTVMNCS